MFSKIITMLSRRTNLVFASVLLIAGGVTGTFALPTTHATYAAGAIPTAPVGGLKLPTLYEGVGNPRAVRALQEQLNVCYSQVDFTAHPYAFRYPLAVDGSFGPQTLYAVKDFQYAYLYIDKQADGIVGPLTWKALGTCAPTGFQPIG